jgi:hypothetical protein
VHESRGIGATRNRKESESDEKESARHGGLQGASLARNNVTCGEGGEQAAR